jgi:hypothetical protein
MSGKSKVSGFIGAMCGVVLASAASATASSRTSDRLDWNAQTGGLGPIRDIAMWDHDTGWAVGDQLIKVEDGQWRVWERPLTMQRLEAVAVWPGGKAIAVGSEVIAEMQGDVWEPAVVPGIRLRDVALYDESHAWVVGERPEDGSGVIGLWRDGAWEPRAMLSSPVVAVAAAPPVVYAATAPGALWRLQNDLWVEVVPNDADFALHDIAVDGAGQIWAVGGLSDGQRSVAVVSRADLGARDWNPVYREPDATALTDIDAHGGMAWAVAGTGLAVVMDEAGGMPAITFRTRLCTAFPHLSTGRWFWRGHTTAVSTI